MGEISPKMEKLSREKMTTEGVEQAEEEQSPIEQVALTVSTTDDPSLPVWTFRMWILGILSCMCLSFLNQFFSYRTEPLIITLITVQVAALPIGRFMAFVLPTKKFHLPFTDYTFTLNPGPFNVKEHVLITIFANAGSAFGNGPAYAVYIVDIVKAFYLRNISFVAGWLIIITTQVLGYGWAGLFRRYLIEPAHMWWPSTLVQVSLFRTLHEKEAHKGLSRSQFFLIAMVASFSYYVLPGYLFSTLTYVSWVCWIFSRSVLAQQISSGFRGLGVGAISLDWAGVSAYLLSPLVSPFFAIVNIAVGFVLFIYLLVPVAYWNDWYHAKRFPIFSSKLFNENGTVYDIQAVLSSDFTLNTTAYNQLGQVHLSITFALAYGLGFATIAATVTHVVCFYGKEIWYRSREAMHTKKDIHARLMEKYPDIPWQWWAILLFGSVGMSLVTCLVFKDKVQLPWWGLLLACVLAAGFTLPIGVITATTNQTPGLNIITEYIMGYILPGYPLANVCFKVYGYMSMNQAVSFLADFKLGHYMKVPPRSMFLVQVIGTVIAGTVNMGVAWWLLNSITDICNTDKLPASSPWTCPGDAVFFDASVIWGLVGPRKIFGSQGVYPLLNWFFLVGAMASVIVWLCHRLFPKVWWIPYINMPVLLGATSLMPPATTVNYTSWIIIGTVFNYFVFKYHKGWWKRYNYVLSAAMDAGVAFMAVALYIFLQLPGAEMNWWGTNGDHCPLSTCPTAPGIAVPGCPVFH
ncbi:hypothetical protein KP509_02G112200 [Ceratopteris richardii]|uniref:Oligopeptide transporter n=1 Tax=Ceratopteris richardii TaxID=49495 RepID=A0A8T2VGM5_CERRI|nr:hypothetical protein KP509_02G112200 [Ceratopteris richardii]KAH7445194.1 hypothetical protein KP509_02G112200 [Ceratopteris richardii]